MEETTSFHTFEEPTTSSEGINFEKIIPAELIEVIFSYLYLKDLAQVNNVSKIFKLIASSPMLWKQKSELHLDLKITEITEFWKTYNELYKSLNTEEKMLFCYVKEGDVDRFKTITKNIPEKKMFRKMYLRDKNGYSLLSWIIFKNYFSLLELIYPKAEKQFEDDGKIDPNKTDEDGRSVLHLAIECKRSNEKIEELIKNGCDVNKLNTFNNATPLHRAVEAGSAETVKLLLKKNADVHAIDREGNTSLHIASQKGNVEIAGLLLAKNADVDVARIDGGGPIHIAVNNGHLKFVQLLIQNNANVNAASTIAGTTSLHLASQEGYLEIVEVLIESKAKINAVSEDTGATPLNAALNTAQLEVAKLLIEKGADVNFVCTKDGSAPLHIVSINGHTEAVKLLIAKNADVKATCTKDGSTPLHVASRNGHIKVVEVLIENKADVNAVRTDNGATPLHVASSHTKVVKVLIENKADVNAVRTDNGSTPLYVALREGHNKTARVLIENNANVNAGRSDSGSTPIYIASLGGIIDVVKSLIEKKADVNVTYKNDNKTPLHAALQNDHIDVARLLIEENADINASLKSGITPLHIATGGNHIGIVQLLLEKNADINADYKDGVTPLYIAADSGHVEIVRLLLEKNANVNVARKNGTTSLYIAAGCGYNEIVQLLLEKNANVNAVSTEGDKKATPLFIASQNGHLAVVESLLKNPDVKTQLALECSYEELLSFAKANNKENSIVDIIKYEGMQCVYQKRLTPKIIAIVMCHSKIAELLSAPKEIYKTRLLCVLGLLKNEADRKVAQTEAIIARVEKLLENSSISKEDCDTVSKIINEQLQVNSDFTFFGKTSDKKTMELNKQLLDILNEKCLDSPAPDSEIATMKNA